MGKKRNLPKTTPEEEARRDETLRALRERVAYREAKEREFEAARARDQK